MFKLLAVDPNGHKTLIFCKTSLAITTYQPLLNQFGSRITCQYEIQGNDKKNNLEVMNWKSQETTHDISLCFSSLEQYCICKYCIAHYSQLPVFDKRGMIACEKCGQWKCLLHQLKSLVIPHGPFCVKQYHIRNLLKTLYLIQLYDGSVSLHELMTFLPMLNWTMHMLFSSWMNISNGKSYELKKTADLVDIRVHSTTWVIHAVITYRIVLHC